MEALGDRIHYLPREKRLIDRCRYWPTLASFFTRQVLHGMEARAGIPSVKSKRAMKHDAFFVTEPNLPFQTFETPSLELLEHSTVHQEGSWRLAVVGIYVGKQAPGHALRRLV